MKESECIKRFADDLAVIYSEFETESAVTKPSGGINYWLIAVFLLAAASLLLLAIIIMYYIER